MPQVRDEVLQRLDRWSQADLPAVVDFLLATVTKEDAARVVAELRRGINLTGRMEASQRPGAEQPAGPQATAPGAKLPRRCAWRSPRRQAHR